MSPDDQERYKTGEQGGGEDDSKAAAAFLRRDTAGHYKLMFV
jgi:hypothetical protein